MDRAAPMSATGADPAPAEQSPADAAPADLRGVMLQPVAPAGALIPFDHLDKVCFVAQNRELGVSFAPVWQLRIEGDFDPAIARRVVAALIQRYPIIASHAVSTDRKRPVARARHLAYQLDPTATADQLFDEVDLSRASEDERREFQRQYFNHHVDIEVDYPLRLTWARTGPHSGTLYIQQHHAIADGKAFFEMLDTFCRFYDEIAAGGEPGPIVAIAKLDEATVAEPRRWRRFLHRYLGYWYHFRMTLGGTLVPMGKLISNFSRDYTGDNAVTHAYFDAAIIDRMRALRTTTGCSVNDFLTTAMAISLYRWSEAHGAAPARFCLLIPADARPRGFAEDSFANHLSSFVVIIKSKLIERPVDLLQAVHRQIARQARRRYHIKALLAGIGLLDMVSVATLKKAIYGAKKTGFNFSFSNLIGISPTANQGRFATATWRAERLEIMTPCGFLQGINTTVIRYAGKLCFNFNFKDSCADADSIDQLIARFRTTLDQVIAAAERT